MQLSNILDDIPLIRHFIILNFAIITIVSFSGCDSQSQNDISINNPGTPSQFVIPPALRSFALPTDTTAYSARLYLDDASSPIATSPIATDGSDTTVSFDNITVAVGTHTFTLKFQLETSKFGTTILATALSDTIIIKAGTASTLNFEITRYVYPDDDNDLVPNIDEIAAGTPPTRDDCYVGLSFLNRCRLGA